MDELRLEVDRPPPGAGEGAYVRAHVNGRDLLDLRAAHDPDAAAHHAIMPLQARAFPRGLFYGDAGYADSPFDDRVALLRGRYCSACCDLLARITVHSDRVEWTHFGRPDLGTRGWGPSPLGHHFGTFVFGRSEYDAALDDSQRRFSRLVSRDAVDGRQWMEDLEAVKRLVSAVPECLAVDPPDADVYREDPEQVAAVLVPRLRHVVAATAEQVTGGRTDLAGNDLERLRIWRWELARSTARLEERLAEQA